MQVHCDHVIAPGRLEHVGHQLRGDGGSGFVLLVLPSIRKIGDDGCNASSRSGLAGIDDDE